MMEFNDEPVDETRELAQRASGGDDVAIETLLERHLPGLRAFLRLRMGPELRAKESADDLVQSTCREVLQHMDRYRYQGEGNFRHWLFTTALRKVANRVQFYRAGKRDVAREIRPADGPSGQDGLAGIYQTISTPSRHMMHDEMVRNLEAAFDRLSEAHREIILLSRIVGLSHAEVAAATGRTEVATRSLLHRALSNLANEMERDGAR